MEQENVEVIENQGDLDNGLQGQEPEKQAKGTFDYGTPEPKFDNISGDSATDGEEPAKEDQEIFDQEKANHAFAEQKRKVKEAEARAEAAERKAKEIQEQLEMKSSELPPLPDMPDRYDYDTDEDYQAALRPWLELSNKHAIKADNDRRKQEEAKKSEEAKQAEQRRLFEESRKQLDDEFNKRSAELNISDEQNRANVKILVEDYKFIPHPILADSISTDPQGPLIQDFLAKNRDAVEKISGMQVPQAISYIYREIVPNLKINEKPKPPNPSTPKFRERNTPTQKSDAVRRAKFE